MDIDSIKWVTVYTFSNGFMREADGMFGWLRHANLNPMWGEWKDGKIDIKLPEGEVSCLRMMQRHDPARYGNAPQE